MYATEPIYMPQYQTYPTHSGHYGLAGDTLLGLLAGVTEVKALQTALRNVGADPGNIDGVVGAQTLTALSQVLTQIPSIPNSLRPILFAALSLAISMGRGTPAYNTAVGLVSTNAAILAAGVSLLASRGGAAPSGTPGGAPGFPAGSYQRWHKSRKVWRAYAPRTSLQGACLGCQRGNGLGGVQEELAVLVAESQTKFPNLPEHDPEDDPIYKKPWFWAAAGGGVVVIGSVIWYVLK